MHFVRPSDDYYICCLLFLFLVCNTCAILFSCAQLQIVEQENPQGSRSSVAQDQRSESPKEFVWWFLLAVLMTPPWRANVITVTGQHSGLRIARLTIHVASLSHVQRVQRALGSTPTATLSMNVSRQIRWSSHWGQLLLSVWNVFLVPMEH